MNDKPKILIAVPSMDLCATPFAMSLAMLTAYTAARGICYLQLANISGSLIYAARDKLVGQAIKTECDYIMWFDSDMTFDQDTLERLLKAAEENDADIVSGLYFRRSPPYSPVAFSDFQIVEGEPSGKHKDYEGELSGMHEVGAVGFGCVLTSVGAVLDILAKNKSCFSPIGSVGEDLAFCWRARELGYKVLLDCDIKCGHVGHVVVKQQLYESLGGEHESKS